MIHVFILQFYSWSVGGLAGFAASVQDPNKNVLLSTGQYTVGKTLRV